MRRSKNYRFSIYGSSLLKNPSSEFQPISSSSSSSRRRMGLRVGLVGLVVADLAMAFLWVFLNAILRLFAELVASYVGISGSATQALKRCIVIALLFLFYLLGKTTGGGTYNPVTAIAYAAAKITDTPLYVLAFRLPAQVIGAVGGAFGAVAFMPNVYKSDVTGPYLRVDPHTGAIAEGLLTFAVVFIVLLANLRGPKSEIKRTWITSISRVFLSIFGTEYTGPAMNPANAFGWAFLKGQHNTWEHLYVYWLTPILATVGAAWVVRTILAPAKIKEKKS